MVRKKSNVMSQAQKTGNTMMLQINYIKQENLSWKALGWTALEWEAWHQ